MSIGRNTHAGEKLTAFVQRMEKLQEELEGLQGDLKDLKAEVKADGFNVRAVSKLVAIRRNKKKAEVEAELLNDLVLYAHATGTLFDLVLDDSSPTSSETHQSPHDDGGAEAVEVDRETLA